MDPNAKQREALIQLLEQRPEIDGRFKNLKRIGPGASGGNFSAVLRAFDSVTGSEVALKFLLPSFIGGYRDESFDRESVLLGELRGQNDIVQMVSPRSTFQETLRTEQGLEFPIEYSYYAVELAAGDVEEVIASALWDAEDLLVAHRQMVRAVQRLHSRGIAHRDLRPSNFLVMDDGSVKISDLGTARKVLDGTPPIGVYTGPPGARSYSAPEMHALLHTEAPQIAMTADFFSLGAILFEMFTGVQLGTRIYDVNFLSGLGQAMFNIPTGQRRRVYDQFVGSIADARIIPPVALLNSSIAPILRDPLDRLIGQLAAIDYRKRLCDFASVFNRLNVCLITLRRQEEYQKKLAKRRMLRAVSAGRLS